MLTILYKSLKNKLTNNYNKKVYFNDKNLKIKI